MNTLSADAAQDDTQLGRGQSVFNVDHLQSALAELPAGQLLAGEVLLEYEQFYGFDVLLGDVSHQVSVLQIDGERVVVHRFTPPQVKGYVLLCHGYYDHVGLYGHIVDYLTERGLMVVAYDQLGHGLSSGARASVDSFDRYVAVTQAVYQDARSTLGIAAGTEFHWVGQSMGGAIVMETLQQHADIEHGNVVLFAPLVRPYAWWFAKWVYALARRTVESLPRRITTNSSNVEFIRLQHADPLQPDILPVQWVSAMVSWFERFEQYAPSLTAPRIIQGERDKTIDWRYGKKLIKKRYPDSQWCQLPEASHHLVNESDTLREQMWCWLDEQCRWGS